MALLSPGVQVTVTDESFSTGAGPGTVPLIFIATEENKTTPDGTEIASGTTSATAGNLFLISSQRELLQTFGNPDFNEIGGSAQNGYPLNEYGLLAAYSYLGVANRAFVVRADVDLAQLDPQTTAPTGAPANNTYWVDLNNFVPGIFEWNGSSWVEKTAVSVFENTSNASLDGTTTGAAGFQTGNIIASFSTSSANVPHLEFYILDSAGLWQKLGEPGAAVDFQWAPHTNVPGVRGNTAGDPLVVGDIWLKTTTPNNGLSINVKRYDSSVSQFVDLGTRPIFDNPFHYYSQTGVDSSAIAAGTIIGVVDQIDAATTDANPSGNSYQPQDGADADVLLQIHNGNSTTILTSTTTGSPSLVTPSTFDIATIPGATPVTVSLSAGTLNNVVAEITNAIATDAGATAAGVDDIVAGITSTGALTLTETNGADVILSNYTGDPVGEIGFPVTGTYSNFENLDTAVGNTYVASFTQPVGDIPFGTYWYDPSFIVDILVKGTTGWIEIADDIFVQADDPVTTGGAVTDGDLWVETDRVEDYPVIYRRISSTWVQVDNADQTTPLGIVFADARPTNSSPAANGVNNGGGSNPDLDGDAPDPAQFPGGVLLFNTRYSGRNVKIWTEDATTENIPAGGLVDRFVSASGLNADGSLITGEQAQKRVVIDLIAATITSNEDIRNDTIFYNLIAAPGFPELIDEMIALNTDRGEQAFVIGDSPFNLASNATALQAWASNSNNATGNGDVGLVSASPNLGVYYPSGLSTNVDGSEVVVPASHMVLRQMAFNDQVSYPWFAPAGFARGTITNASAVGYLNAEDEFVSVTLNKGQRDTLYTNNVNPIAVLPGRGIVIFGQKTRNATAGALDRVNVARLVNFIRFEADQLAQPFLFAPNDTTTRDAIKEAFDSFLAELVTLRGVSDFLVVVDESNNTPSRIDRNELWVDIAIQPVQAVEFIFIPIRLQNTGTDLNL